MMESFPAELDLVDMFGCEPVRSDPALPWEYNAVRFETRRGRDHVVCELQPGYEELEFRWSRDGEELVRLALQDVRCLWVERETGREALVAELRGEQFLLLRLELAPRVRLSWVSRNA